MKRSVYVAMTIALAAIASSCGGDPPASTATKKECVLRASGEPVACDDSFATTKADYQRVRREQKQEFTRVSSAVGLSNFVNQYCIFRLSDDPTDSSGEDTYELEKKIRAWAAVRRDYPDTADKFDAAAQRALLAFEGANAQPGKPPCDRRLERMLRRLATEVN